MEKKEKEQQWMVKTNKMQEEPVKFTELAQNRKEEEVDSVGDEDEKLCKICFANPENITLIPCGHVCMCSECAKIILAKPNAQCPICKATIQQTMRIYII